MKTGLVTHDTYMLIRSWYTYVVDTEQRIETRVTEVII